MFPKFIIMSLAVLLLGLAGFTDAAQDKKKKRRTGAVTGVLKARKPAPNKINVLVEIQADGEEKARTYRVVYDPKIKAPKADVLKAVKEAKIGSRVQIDWIEGEGFNITAIQILKKADKK